MPDRLRPALLAAALALAACPAKSEKKAADPARGADAAVRAPLDAGPALAPDGTVVLPPAPPVPEPPAGMPPLPASFAATAEELALGELLFHEPRLGADGKTTCVSCHDPKRDHGGDARAQTAAGKPNLRRAPALSNLAWVRDLGWDGRGPDPASFLRGHATGQLGQSIDDAVVKLGASPTYRAHLARAANGRGQGETATAALLAYALTRFDGDAPWDRHERGVANAVGPDAIAGYALFTGRALCASCHPPPLYTDHAFHRLGLVASPDDGRGRVDPAQAGAFRTPGLRGAARRAPLFHDGSAADLDAAIEWHLAGGRGQGADASLVDPGLEPVTLTPAERAQLGAFVRALTSDAPPPRKPVLPEDVP